MRTTTQAVNLGCVYYEGSLYSFHICPPGLCLFSRVLGNFLDYLSLFKKKIIIIIRLPQLLVVACGIWLSRQGSDLHWECGHWTPREVPIFHSFFFFFFLRIFIYVVGYFFEGSVVAAPRLQSTGFASPPRHVGSSRIRN